MDAKKKKNTPLSYVKIHRDGNHFWFLKWGNSGREFKEERPLDTQILAEICTERIRNCSDFGITILEVKSTDFFHLSAEPMTVEKFDGLLEKMFEKVLVEGITFEECVVDIGGRLVKSKISRRRKEIIADYVKKKLVEIKILKSFMVIGGSETVATNFSVVCVDRKKK